MDTFVKFSALPVAGLFRTIAHNDDDDVIIDGTGGEGSIVADGKQTSFINVRNGLAWRAM